MDQSIVIGGDSDGDRINVRDDMTQVRLPEKKESLVDVRDVGRIATIRADVQTYRRLYFQAGNLKLAVFVYEKLSDEAALTLLVNGYRRA
jgi:hypothetical protein